MIKTFRKQKIKKKKFSVITIHIQNCLSITLIGLGKTEKITYFCVMYCLSR